MFRAYTIFFESHDPKPGLFARARARAHTHTLSLRHTLLKWFEVLNVLLNRKPGPGPD